MVLKAVSAELPHKSEAGAVRVNLQDAGQLLQAVEAMRHSIAEAAPALEFRQVLIESMVEDVIAELMIGINPLMRTPHGCIAADVMTRETTT